MTSPQLTCSCWNGLAATRDCWNGLVANGPMEPAMEHDEVVDDVPDEVAGPELLDDAINVVAEDRQPQLMVGGRGNPPTHNVRGRWQQQKGSRGGLVA